MYYFQRPEARLDKCNKTVNIKVVLHFWSVYNLCSKLCSCLFKFKGISDLGVNVSLTSLSVLRIYVVSINRNKEMSFPTHSEKFGFTAVCYNELLRMHNIKTDKENFQYTQKKYHI